MGEFLGLQEGSVDVYCDSKGALRNTFDKIYEGLSPYVQADYDIINQAKCLLKTLHFKVNAKWVKGHSTARTKTLQEELNILADMLAGQFVWNPHPRHIPAKKLLPPPNYKVRLLFQGSTIASKLHSILASQLHCSVICNHIMKKTKWPQGTFEVDWDAHVLAFRQLTCKSKISTAKLIHHLVNTNWQNNLYYGTSLYVPAVSKRRKHWSTFFSAPPQPCPPIAQILSQASSPP